jgi:hypothetical protein
VEEVPFFRGHGRDAVGGVLALVMHPQETGEVAAGPHLLVDLIRNLLRLVPLADIRFDVLGYPGADFVAEGGVGFVEVGGVVLFSSC